MKKRHWVDRLLFGFLILWSLFTIIEDGLTAWDIFRQLKSRDYPHVMGVITKNETICHDYDNYEVKIAYSYQVDSQNYTGDRYIYNAALFGKTTDGSQWKAEELERALPVGKQVPIYYDPTNPADSVIKTGILKDHVSLFAGLVFFNSIMLVGWIAVIISKKIRMQPR
jgi:hypothetical protein